MYEAMVRDNNTTFRYLSDSGSIPVAKISYVGTSSVQKQGCDQTKVVLLAINETRIAIPTEKQAKRLQRIIDDVVNAQ